MRTFVISNGQDDDSHDGHEVFGLHIKLGLGLVTPRYPKCHLTIVQD